MILKKLAVVFNIIYAGENFFKIAKSKLLLFKVQNNLYIIICQFLKTFFLQLL